MHGAVVSALGGSLGVLVAVQPPRGEGRGAWCCATRSPHPAPAMPLALPGHGMIPEKLLWAENQQNSEQG